MKTVKPCRFSVLFQAIVWCGVVLSGSAIAHEFDDGFVERSTSYIIQDDKLFVEYSLGLNSVTMSQQLKAWGVEVPTPEKPEEKAGTQSEKRDSADTSTVSTSERESTAGNSVVERLFRERVGTQIKSKLKVQVNQTAVELKLISNEISATHHVNMTVKFEVKLSEGKSVDLLLEDSNFLNMKGGVRYALKSRGQSMVLSTNVEPSLVRAERVELGKIKLASRPKYTRVEAKVIVARSPAKKESKSR